MNKRAVVAVLLYIAISVVSRIMNWPDWIFWTAGLIILFYIIIKHYWFSWEEQ